MGVINEFYYNDKFLTRKPPFSASHSLSLRIKLVPLFAQQKHYPPAPRSSVLVQAP